ncbi:MAG: type VI secretion system baseplate subunit TssF, partial [Gammaproteobacteria bacterium]|nr:type VI secretion system baseplate subunit TssF [Gammaproteobacteria bacterium]
SMLEVLYPHYLAPIPSMSIVQFKVSPDLTAPYRIAENSPLETEAIDGEPCKFKTVYPVELLPIEISNAQIIRGSYQAPALGKHFGAIGVVRIKLRCRNPDVSFRDLSPEQLVFYLKGQSAEVAKLYELLFNHTVAIAIADSSQDANASFLEPEALKPVGFEQDEGMLPYPARSQLAYRLLTEYFVFPEKFNFFKLDGLGEKVFQNRKQEIELYFYINDSFSELENSISHENFVLGCTPVVNLFSQYAEAFTLDHKKTEYHVIPDSRRLLAKEIYSIDSVEATSPDGVTLNYKPFYGLTHFDSDREKAAYWHATRKAAETRHANEIDDGTEMYLSLVDVDFRDIIEDDWVVSVKTTCLNRDLPARLPFGGGQPRLQLGEGNAPLESIQCLVAPTKTRRIELQESTRWRLISHLNLNHLSITDSENGVEILKEILSLYNFDNSQANRSLIEGILKVESRQVMSRVRDQGISALCRGLEIIVTLDDDRYEGQGMYLFGCVLERFFALYASINSFTKLTIKRKRSPVPLKTWTPRSGLKALL